jgi:hypothetical protein
MANTPKDIWLLWTPLILKVYAVPQEGLPHYMPVKPCPAFKCKGAGDYDCHVCDGVGQVIDQGVE